MSDAPGQNRSPRRFSFFTLFLALAVAGLSTIALLLSREVNRLRSELAAAETALVQERTRGSLDPGEKVEPLRLVLADGTESLCDFAGDRATLILLVSGECPHCADALTVWDRVLTRTEAASSSRVRVVCVQVDADLPAQIKPTPASIQPSLARDAVHTWLRRIPISPAALWVDQTGTIRRSWFGIPGQREEGELAEYLLGARS